MLPQIRAGKVRAIAVLTEKRLKQLPDLLTSGEQGYGKYIGTSWSSIVAPAKTPQDVIEKVSADIMKVVNDPSFRDKLEAQGAELFGASPAEAEAFLIKEDKLWGPLVKASGVKPEN